MYYVLYDHLEVRPLRARTWHLYCESNGELMSHLEATDKIISLYHGRRISPRFQTMVTHATQK
jgi:hypothetical protein